MTKLVCTNCANFEGVHKNPVCDPCQFFIDGRQPTGWAAIQAPGSAGSIEYSDKQRLDWLMPVMSLADGPASVGAKRTIALEAALQMGKQGRAAIDFAMEGSP